MKLPKVLITFVAFILINIFVVAFLFATYIYIRLFTEFPIIMLGLGLVILVITVILFGVKDFVNDDR